jgi:hypothetical protein
MSFELGVRDALAKVAALDSTVHEVVDVALKAHLPKGKAPSLDDELETLLPEDGDLEAAVTAIEDNFDIHLSNDEIFALFADGTVGDLEKMIVRQLTGMKKKASYSHSNYMRNRAQHQQRSRQYRMRNMHQIRRKSRIYRKQVQRGARRKRKRMGSAAGGFSFIRQ